jgi:phage terminase small subunit
MNITQIWQSVLAKLQTEMGKASFETWVKDTRPIAQKGTLLIVGVRNQYAQEWLSERLTAQVERLLAEITHTEMSVQFAVDAETEDDVQETASAIFAADDALKARKPEDEVEVSLADYDSLYERVVRPNRAVYLPGYFRRWLRRLGPSLAWLYVAFRQTAYMAGSRTGRATNRIPGDKIAALAGCSERTYWRRVENPGTWQKLKGLVEVSDHGAQWDNTASNPRRLPRRYTVAMTLPLTPADTCSLTRWLSSHIDKFGGPEGVLRAAAETPLDELIPLDAADESDPLTVTQLVRQLFGRDEPDVHLDALASALQNHIMAPGNIIKITEYFLRTILPHLGEGPAWALTLLRDMCYVNPESGEVRNRVVVRGGYAEIAGWLGFSRPKTIWEWLKEPVVSIYISEITKDEPQLDFAGQPRTFKVLLEEFPREMLEAAVANGANDSIGVAQVSVMSGANDSIGVAQVSVMSGANDSIGVARMTESVGASVRVLINSLTLKTNSLTLKTTTVNTDLSLSAEKTKNDKNDKTVKAAAVGASPSAWVLDRILIQNRVHPKTQKDVRGASSTALVSWLLYALSPQGQGIEKPLSYALARLKDDPQSGAGDEYDKLAGLAPARLLEIAYRVSKGQLHEAYSGELDDAAELWVQAMGTDERAARKLMRFLLGDQAPEIREHVTKSEKIEFFDGGVEIISEERVEEI